MPIFEYVCEDCNKPFEALLLGDEAPECPECHGQHLKQQISVFSVGPARENTLAGAGCGSPSCCMGSGGCGEDA